MTFMFSEINFKVNCRICGAFTHVKFAENVMYYEIKTEKIAVYKI